MNKMESNDLFSVFLDAHMQYVRTDSSFFD